MQKSDGSADTPHEVTRQLTGYEMKRLNHRSTGAPWFRRALGALTAAIGVPLFLLLIRRSNKYR